MNQEYSDKSRSQKKREGTALQNLGEQLAALSPSALTSLELPDALLDALREWHKVKTHEAKRRQMQYIGRLMREEGDEAAIRERLDALLAPGREESAARAGARGWIRPSRGCHQTASRRDAATGCRDRFVNCPDLFSKP